MANRIQPHPNPPYLKSDGTLNASGQIKTYEAGTSTPKVVYKDASGTSYGSTIDLDASGLPDEGPIYWDDSALYKVEVYYDDGAGGYALDYTVDNYGGQGAVNDATTISTATQWTVDGVGGTATTFATVGAAFDAARGYSFIGLGALTINVDAGTFTEDNLNVAHPQGERISIVGDSKSTTIIKNTSNNSPVINIPQGYKLGGITTCTIEQDASVSGNGYGIYLGAGAALNYLAWAKIQGDISATYGIYLEQGARVHGQLSVEIVDFTTAGIYVKNGAQFTQLGNVNIDDSTNGGMTYGIYCVDSGSSVYVGSLDVTGSSTTEIIYGIYCNWGGRVTVDGDIDMDECDYAVFVGVNGIVDYGQASSPSFTNITTGTPHNIAVDTFQTSGANVGSCIIS